MKKYIYSATVMLALCVGFLASCVEDDSTYSDHSVYLELSGLEEKYEVVSFSSDKLEINPVVRSSFSDDDLAYAWSYYDPSPNYTSTNVDTVRADTISYEKNLSYNPAVSDGTYTLVFTVWSKSTGYRRSIKTTFSASSALSRGFYVLKETADGNTDLDLYNTRLQELIPDVLTNYQGKAMSGKPRCLDVIHGQAYINDEGKETSTNMLCVTTENNEVQWIRALDCKTIFTPQNVHFEYVPNEIPYRTVRGYWEVYYVTSNGIYSAYSGMMGGSGVLGAYDGTGGSVHVVSGASGAYYGILYWSNQTRSFETSDYNAGYAPASSGVPGYGTQNLDLECLACGLNMAAGEKQFFLMQDRSNPSKKYIYYFSFGFMGATLTDVRELDENSGYGNATLRAVCDRQATIAYYVKDNKVFTYDLVNENPDKELTLQGIPAGEQISHISYRPYYGSGRFSYFVVGTQSGNTYKVYMYETRAGEPIGDPVITFSGTGKLSRISYIDPATSDMTDGAAMPILDE